MLHISFFLINQPNNQMGVWSIIVLLQPQHSTIYLVSNLLNIVNWKFAKSDSGTCHAVVRLLFDQFNNTML